MYVVSLVIVSFASLIFPFLTIFYFIIFHITSETNWTQIESWRLEFLWNWSYWSSSNNNDKTLSISASSCHIKCGFFHSLIIIFYLPYLLITLIRVYFSTFLASKKRFVFNEGFCCVWNKTHILKTNWLKYSKISAKNCLQIIEKKKNLLFDFCAFLYQSHCFFYDFFDRKLRNNLLLITVLTWHKRKLEKAGSRKMSFLCGFAAIVELLPLLFPDSAHSAVCLDFLFCVVY